MPYPYTYADSKRPASSPYFENDLEYEATVQEAERLLSQFTQYSGSKGHSGPVTHGHTRLIPGPTQDGWQTKRTIQVIESRNPTDSPHNYRSPHYPGCLKPSNPQLKRPNHQDSMRKTVAVSNATKYKVDPRVQTSDASEKTAQTPALKSRYSKSSSESSASAIRTQFRVSSSAYRSSSSPARSPEPHAAVVTTRRSGRPRKDPVTYNIRTLSGLDRKGRESDPFGNTVSSEEEPSPHFSHVSQTRSTVLNLAVGPNEIRKGRSHTAKYFRKLLQEREIRGRQALGPMRATASSQIKLWKSWKGASNDVNTVAWSPDGTRFAAGATTQSDVYNRSNNLVLGDLVRSSLDELPDHWTHWTPGSAPASTTDPRCFSSVSAVQWLGERLYSASYDQTVKIWDVETTPRASCLQTLKHDSEVVVMALSSWMPRYLATGAQGFVLWNTTDTSAPIQLPILRSTLQKAQINLTPTALMWGQSPAMSRFLVGGMAQPLQDTEKISQHGHLGLWKLEEAGVTTRKLTPDSQNIFDIKWHPFMSRFVTASTPGVSSSLKLPRGYRSVVRMYEYEATGDNFKATTEFACPALDINEVTMCPMSTAYVTASCTDGSTYVWDNRNPGRILHKLQHGSSSTPLQHGVDREISDFGVRVALWGSTMDQFYTGGSDCYLKQWDIRRSPDDVLVANTAKFGHDIVSGAFSEDKTQLLIGDYGGGIHVLSCSPCADPDATKFNFNHAPQPVAPSNEQNGVTLANELVASGQLMMHRRYGPVQGPNYTGPFSRWARGLSTDEPKPETIAEIPLLEECQLRQFDGPKVKHRLGLDEKGKKEVRNEMKKAKVRNGRYSRSVTTSSQMEARIKRERRSRSISVPHELKRRRTESGESSRVITNTDPVDLTEDSDVESLGLFDLSPWEKLLENLEDDFYYPENRSLDPNFPKDE